MKCKQFLFRYKQTFKNIVQQTIKNTNAIKSIASKRVPNKFNGSRPKLQI